MLQIKEKFTLNGVFQPIVQNIDTPRERQQMHQKATSRHIFPMSNGRVVFIGKKEQSLETYYTQTRVSLEPGSVFFNKRPVHFI